MDTKRSIFTSGVRIGLAPVPSAAIIGLAMVTGDLTLALQAAGRLGLDVLLVMMVPLAYFMWWRVRFHKRLSRLRRRNLRGCYFPR